MAQHRANMVPRLLGRRPSVRRKPLNKIEQVTPMLVADLTSADKRNRFPKKLFWLFRVLTKQIKGTGGTGGTACAQALSLS